MANLELRDLERIVQLILKNILSYFIWSKSVIGSTERIHIIVETTVIYWILDRVSNYRNHNGRRCKSNTEEIISAKLLFAEF